MRHPAVESPAALSRAGPFHGAARPTFRYSPMSTDVGVCVHSIRSATLVVGSAISTPLRLLAAAAIASLTVTGCQSLDLTACFTTEAALGSFTGHLDGEPVSVTLTSYRETADGPIFELPTEADVVDRSTSPGT